ncbi:MAG: Cyclic di-GMP phosphodiesterase [Nitrospirae bacterium]|nr:MAG: putative metal dependent phosphohydrolase [Nitrospira sp. OLB3]MBV6469094.1 Cyclic di-GMP phosphodiesterase [Nitrospirota bacterium]MCE7965938.1 HD-GYP domain-containing protein [Nitrospira sp. NTP2]MCK6493296.1 DUF3391 domain-containing protein [Nitrospira sp.]MEB2338476.1 DUF3391 domain-containing protein [Nitrospirales bacterium]
MSEKRDNNSTHAVAPEAVVLQPSKLRVGMYVDLNCAWFKHPFPRRSFKISTAHQIATIQGIGLATVLVYPSLSTREALEEEKEQEASRSEASADPLGQQPPAAPATAQQDYQEAVELTSEAYRSVLDRSAQVMSDLCSGSPEGLAKAEGMIKGLSGLMTHGDATGAVASGFDPVEVDNVNVLNALNIATLSMLVARQFELDEEQVRLIGMAGLLLDIGEQRVPQHILQTRSRRAQVEQVKYQHHPYYSVDMLRKYPGIPEAVLDMVRSHHERLDGSGYPEKLKGDQLSLPLRIITAVEQYNSLINSLDPQDALSPAEALATMYKIQKHLFASDVVIAMIHALGVYPPGTVVNLSDESLALVLNINFEHRLKPLVLVYDQVASSRQPATLDLSLDAQLSIVRAVPKAELPAEVADYFHVKRWTGYFVQAALHPADEQAAA